MQREMLPNSWITKISELFTLDDNSNIFRGRKKEYEIETELASISVTASSAYLKQQQLGIAQLFVGPPLWLNESQPTLNTCRKTPASSMSSTIDKTNKCAKL